MLGFIALRITENTVKENVPASCYVKSPCFVKLNVGRSMATVGCNANDVEDTLEFLVNRIGGGLAIPASP